MSIYHIHILFLLLAFLFILPKSSSKKQPPIPTSRITVVGVVYCDICSTNTFSRHSYFLPGADVQIQCRFDANSPKTTEQITFSVNRTTDKNGVYKLEIPHVDGVDCVDGMAIVSQCQARLIKSSSSACNVPGLITATNEVSVKSKQDSLCIYSLKALSYTPLKKNVTLCGVGNRKERSDTSFGSSKFFFPYYFPPFWPPLPELPPLPSLPPFPFPFPFQSPPSLPFPFPSPPSLPFPFPSAPPSLPFPFPPLAPFPPTPSLFHPPPPPGFNLGDPRTWIPNIPLLSPPPPPAFNPWDPRTWIPYLPPSPPSSTSQSQNTP